ncbi:MAG: LemA family protein [Bacteroidetes bacterium]|jgi:LemA protein|nr:LemA family protein [Bacteroidota bacterium]MBX7130190.1 LemA family protein [Flavobacteriales bacterium]MCC6653530.1 LemA family protein [Flavobacteriales bacterium]HMU14562.1 LemA family protein [Flavobacteriales bacterium]HMW98163.1 LemA family protein [Flavobacteriales bacterium]
MKRSLIPLLIIGGLVLLVFFWAVGFQRSVTGLNEGVAEQWANVENAYQLRADKTKNLVEIVKGAADFEKSTLTAVIEARAKATSIQLKVDDLTPEKIAQFQEAQDKLSGALSRLLVAVEQYPNLKATDAFRDLQAQYEGMENRIGVERRKFNEVARTYNTRIKQIPGSLLAGFFGFTEKGYFKAQEGTENAPDISFK